MAAWEEIAPDGFRRRYQPHDVSVCVVRGTGGLLVCDARSSHRQADEIRADLRELGTLPVRWVVNTHAHFDHTFGNARFGPGSDLGAQHEQLAAAAALVRELHAAGVPAEHAEEEAGDRWPFPEGLPGCGLAAAARDGYRQLNDPDHC